MVGCAFAKADFWAIRWAQIVNLATQNSNSPPRAHYPAPLELVEAISVVEEMCAQFVGSLLHFRHIYM